MTLKLTAAALAACLSLCMTAVQPSTLSLPTMTAAAEEAAAYTEYQEGALTFYLYDAYAIVATCDKSVTQVEIPDTVQGLPVTELRTKTFYNCSSLTQITLPSGLRKIGKEAFCNCSVLNSVILPQGLEEIGEGAFRSCFKLTEIIIPDSVTTLASYAFYGCSTLKSVSIPASVGKINDYTFYSCLALPSVIVPEGIESIGNNAFFGCTRLKEITIPGTVAWIGFETFNYCGNLDTVYFSGSAEQWNELRSSDGSGNLTEANVQYTAPIQPEPTTEPTTEPTPSAGLPGDVNEDGTVDVLDIILLNKNLLGGGSLTAQGRQNADVDDDGTASPNDSLMIMKYIVKLIEAL